MRRVRKTDADHPSSAGNEPPQDDPRYRPDDAGGGQDAQPVRTGFYGSAFAPDSDLEDDVDGGDGAEGAGGHPEGGTAPAKKRRRRRRKPSGGGEGAPPAPAAN